MLIAVHGVKLCAHCYKRSEVICSLLYMECSFLLNPIHEVKFCADCLTWSKALCSLLYMK